MSVPDPPATKKEPHVYTTPKVSPVGRSHVKHIADFTIVKTPQGKTKAVRR